MKGTESKLVVFSKGKNEENKFVTEIYILYYIVAIYDNDVDAVDDEY